MVWVCVCVCVAGFIAILPGWPGLAIIAQGARVIEKRSGVLGRWDVRMCVCVCGANRRCEGTCASP